MGFLCCCEVDFVRRELGGFLECVGIVGGAPFFGEEPPVFHEEAHDDGPGEISPEFGEDDRCTREECQCLEAETS